MKLTHEVKNEGIYEFAIISETEAAISGFTPNKGVKTVFVPKEVVSKKFKTSFIVTKILSESFSGAWNSGNEPIELLKLPETINNIEGRAFARLKSKEVFIPKNIETTGLGLFDSSYVETIIFESNLSEDVSVDFETIGGAENLKRIVTNGEIFIKNAYTFEYDNIPERDVIKNIQYVTPFPSVNFEDDEGVCIYEELDHGITELSKEHLENQIFKADESNLDYPYVKYEIEAPIEINSQGKSLISTSVEDSNELRDTSLSLQINTWHYWMLMKFGLIKIFCLKNKEDGRLLGHVIKNYSEISFEGNIPEDVKKVVIKKLN